MGFYIKKPLTIEAIKITEENIEHLSKWCKGELEPSEYPQYIEIPTWEGTMKGVIGYYIIKGLSGEFYPHEPELFERVYDEVDEPDFNELVDPIG